MKWVGRFGTPAWRNGNGPVVVELCAGVGGLGLGFHAGGYRVSAAIEIDSAAVDTYSHNFPDVTILGPAAIGDIRKVKGADILAAAGLRIGDVDLIIGGPPCQGYSVAGSRKIDDEKNTLYVEFLRLVDELKPKAYLIENVPGLMSFDGRRVFNHILNYWDEPESKKSARYSVGYSLINAATYGVPQLRNRLFIFGTREDYPELKLHEGPLSEVDYTTVEQAFEDLPLTLENANEENRFTSSYKGEPSLPYAKLMRGASTKATNCIPTLHSPELQTRIGALLEGYMDERTRHRRLKRHSPAWTLRAGTRTDTTTRPIHPTEARVISIREAARLASFPDEFEFPNKKSTSHMLIGNSVPPLLAYNLAMQIAHWFSKQGVGEADLIPLHSIQHPYQMEVPQPSMLVSS